MTQVALLAALGLDRHSMQGCLASLQDAHLVRGDVSSCAGVRLWQGPLHWRWGPETAQEKGCRRAQQVAM